MHAYTYAYVCICTPIHAYAYHIHAYSYHMHAYAWYSHAYIIETMHVFGAYK